MPPPKQEVAQRRVRLDPTALSIRNLDGWAQTLSPRQLHSVVREIKEQKYWWMGWPTAARADALLEEIPLLAGCISRDVLRARWAEIEKPDQGTRIAYGPYEVDMDERGAMDWGPSLTDIAPEVVDVYEACAAAIKGAGGDARERAEAWLWPAAVSAESDGSFEAVVYFASRGESPVTGEEVARRWRAVVYDDVARVVERESPQMAERARNGSISLDDAAELLRRNHMTLHLLRHGHSEDQSIDPTFLRTVGWLNIPGFDAWVESAAQWFSAGPDAGVDGEAALSLFLALRADLALEIAGPDAIQAWIFKFITGGLEKDKPWVEFDWQNGGRRVRVAVAAALVFFWQRTRSDAKPPPAITDALALLSSTQLGSGAWPTFSGDADGCILTTCFVMHALGVARPRGFDSLLREAASWLATQQDPFGYWHIQGGPTTVLTVLALDCLSLAADSPYLTFGRQASSTSPTAHGGVEVLEPEYAVDDQAWHNPARPLLREVPRSEVILPQAPVLLPVATDVELAQVLRAIRPPLRKQRVQKVASSSGTFFVGRLGSFPVVVVQSTMGPDGPGGAMLTVDHAIREWRPRAVIMPGIAFGAQRGVQRPGDVLIARDLIPYESQRVGQETVFRSPRPESNPLLFSRFRGAVDWSFLRPDGTRCSSIVGPMLSGNKLIDSETFKQGLLEEFPDAVGGDMEAAAVWSASEKNHTAWIVVKGVCDWADGRKKGKYQEMAAAAAVSLCAHVLQDEHALDGIPEPSPS